MIMMWTQGVSLMEYVIVVTLTALCVLMVHASLDTREANRVLPVVLAAFFVRLIVHVLVMRSGVIGYGGDNHTYQTRALEVAAYWNREGFRFVTSDQIGSLYSVEVPCNLFGAVVYLVGGPAPLACTAVVALIACGLCVVMYRVARLIGADEPAAFRLLIFVAFLPAFLVHTSDTFKDGINAFLVVACLGLVASNVRRFDVGKLLMLVPLLWALWHVRPYMVFMCGLPLIFGLSSIKRRLSVRGLVVSTVLLAVVLALLEGAGGNSPFSMMQEQLDHGQSAVARNANADGGSGVLFEDSGNAWGAFGPKLLYTLLAPFPWMSGSLALQLGKIDTFFWYYLVYSAVRGARRLWSYDRTLLFVLVLFIIPSTIAYATTMANVGLIFRQRIPIVLVTSLLAAIAWTRTEQGGQRLPSRSAPIRERMDVFRK